MQLPTAYETIKWALFSSSAVIFAWSLPTLGKYNICNSLGSDRASISHYILTTRCAGVFAFLSALPFAAWLCPTIDMQFVQNKTNLILPIVYLNAFRLLLFSGWVLMFYYPSNTASGGHVAGIALIIAGSFFLSAPFVYFDCRNGNSKKIQKCLYLFFGLAIASAVTFLITFFVKTALFLFFSFEAIVYTFYCFLPVFAHAFACVNSGPLDLRRQVGEIFPSAT